MLDPKQLDEFARRFTEHLPPGLRDFQQEIEKNVRAAMQNAFSRMDLVTREEFDTQSKVLARTRSRLEEMEARVAELESKAGITKAGADSADGADADAE